MKDCEQKKLSILKEARCLESIKEKTIILFIAMMLSIAMLVKFPDIVNGSIYMDILIILLILLAISVSIVFIIDIRLKSLIKHLPCTMIVTDDESFG
jgi:hypothetical protein